MRDRGEVRERGGKFLHFLLLDDELMEGRVSVIHLLCDIIDFLLATRSI